jgi:NADPH:quinone reductase-like Zn-dependent oxidoreductase
MKALAISEFNTPPAIVDVPAREPAEGEVLVDVEHASINGMDVAAWAGYLKDVMPYEIPITLGRDFAGSVAAIGPGVTDLAVGDPVWGLIASATLHDGTLAEQLVIPTWSLARRPDGLEGAAAGALALVGIAAQAAIDALALQPGETVLIAGATGGVGSVAIQLAKLAGATVLATATADRTDFVRDLGADQVVDHTGDLAAQVRAIAPGGVDAVLHAAGDPNALADLLRPGGRMASELGFGQGAVGDRDITATAVMSIPSAEALGRLATLVTSGKLRVPVSKTYSLDEAPQALMDFAGGKRGKLAVRIR